jgi:hypothetical protein
MRTDLKVADLEFLSIGGELFSQYEELADIIAQYQSVMNKVGMSGLDSALITARIEGLANRLEPVRGSLKAHRVSLENNINGFVSQIDSVDQF